MIYQGIAVTGADTGAGKTAVACGLALLFRRAGIRVGVLKPVETGWAEGGRGSDALRLAAAAGLKIRDSHLFSGGSLEGFYEKIGDCPELNDVAPWRFAAPLAPEEAARLEGVEIGVDRIYQAMDRWTEWADIVVVETAGGLMTPLNPRFTFADLLQGLELPALVAAANRLGVINHVLLTLEALRRRDVTPIAVVLNDLNDPLDPSADANAALIERHGRVPVLRVPYAKSATAANDGAEIGDCPELTEFAARALAPRLPALLEAMRSDWTRVALRYLGKRTRSSSDPN